MRHAIEQLWVMAGASTDDCTTRYLLTRLAEQNTYVVDELLTQRAAHGPAAGTLGEAALPAGDGISATMLRAALTADPHLLEQAILAASRHGANSPARYMWVGVMVNPTCAPSQVARARANLWSRGVIRSSVSALVGAWGRRGLRPDARTLQAAVGEDHALVVEALLVLGRDAATITDITGHLSQDLLAPMREQVGWVVDLTDPSVNDALLRWVLAAPDTPSVGRLVGEMVTHRPHLLKRADGLVALRHAAQDGRLDPEHLDALREKLPSVLPGTVYQQLLVDHPQLAPERVRAAEVGPEELTAALTGLPVDAWLPLAQMLLDEPHADVALDDLMTAARAAVSD